jgi:hypothetical protein
VAKTLADTYALNNWQQRKVAEGIGRRPDLYALCAATDADDSKSLDEICYRAKEASGGNLGSSLGTAFHNFTETAEKTGNLNHVPAQFRDDMAAYMSAIKEANITIHDNMTELVVVEPIYQIAGMFDRLYDMPGEDLPVIGDLKTAKKVEYGISEIAVQLAIYAHATHIWDPETETYAPMPPVNQDWALVMSLPIGSQKCRLIRVDIAAGWDMMETIQEVRKYKSRATSKLMSLYEPPALPVEDTDSYWLQKIAEAASTETLSNIWKAATLKKQWSDKLLQAGAAKRKELTK